jgi:hypothetical protein
MQSMLTPINDRAAASALVPLVITVPDQAANLFQHISFNRALDGTSIELRKEAVERLAMGLDAPPELLLGTDRMNHWGGWLMREDVVRAHIEPGLALICDALTSQFLWPVAKANEIENWDQYVIWYSVEHMIMNTDRGKDALDLFDRKILSDATARAANGFDDNDAPQTADVKTTATDAVMAMIEANPSLLQFPGADVLFRQVTAVLTGQPLGAQDYNGEVQKDEEQQVAAGIPEAPPIAKSPMPNESTTNVSNTSNITESNGSSNTGDDGSLPTPSRHAGPPGFELVTAMTASGMQSQLPATIPPIRVIDPAALGVQGTYSKSVRPRPTSTPKGAGDD